jgi:hypothetical protein
MSGTAPVFRRAIDEYFRAKGFNVKGEHGQKIDNLGMAMSPVASTRGLTLLPAYARNLLTWSVTSRPLADGGPTIDLMVSCHRANTSAVLKLSSPRIEIDGLIAHFPQCRDREDRSAIPAWSKKSCRSRLLRGLGLAETHTSFRWRFDGFHGPSATKCHNLAALLRRVGLMRKAAASATRIPSPRACGAGGVRASPRGLGMGRSASEPGPGAVPPS